MTGPRRGGFSLLEVLLAAGMLLGSVVVLGHLLGMARHHAESAALLTRAQQLCENRIEEIAVGILPPESASEEPLPEDPAWLCTTSIEPSDELRMLAVSVTVSQAPELNRRPVRFELVRWIRAPGAAHSPQPAAPDTGAPGMPLPPGPAP